MKSELKHFIYQTFIIFAPKTASDFGEKTAVKGHRKREKSECMKLAKKLLIIITDSLLL